MPINSVKRLFSFGCSFTNYYWATWPEIISYDLSVPFFNYGSIGLTNQNIFNNVLQADSFYNFTLEDLIIVQWTSDSSSMIDMLSYIKAISGFLSAKNCEHYFISSYPLIKSDDETNKLVQMNFPYLSKLKKDFSSVVWDNNADEKDKKILSSIGYNFKDNNPSPIDHLTYVEKSFWRVGPKTKNSLQKMHLFWVEEIKNNCANGLYQLSDYTSEAVQNLKNRTTLQESQPIFRF